MYHQSSVKKLVLKITAVFLILMMGFPMQTVIALEDPDVENVGVVENDDFNNATLINTVTYSTTQNTTGATTAGDDPIYQCSAPPQQGYYTVWYRFTPTVDSVMMVNTIGTNWDTILAIWTGSRGSLTLQACNDDFPPTAQSSIQLPVTAGTTYYIEIAGFSSLSFGDLKVNFWADVSIVSPIPVSPSGTVDGQATPTFVWTVFPGATSYKLAVWSVFAQSYLIQSTVATSNCNATQCSYLSPVSLSNGNYRFKVLASTAGGATPYSNWLAFSITGVVIPPPTTPPTLIAPSTAVDTHRPTFQWYAVTDATFYRLAVYSYATYTYLIVENVYPTCVSGVCSYTPTTWDLLNGDYGFKMRSRNSSGYTEFGTMMKFSVLTNLPVAPTLLAPSGTVVTNPPAFQWNEVSGATRYQLLVYSIASGSFVINTYVYPAACSGGVCTYTPAAALASGGYKFKMLTENAYGISGYSAYMSFTVP